jgi:hypothetical protein
MTIMLLRDFLIWTLLINLIKAYIAELPWNVIGGYGPTTIAYVHDETTAARCLLEPSFLQGIIGSKYTKIVMCDCRSWLVHEV